MHIPHASAPVADSQQSAIGRGPLIISHIGAALYRPEKKKPSALKFTVFRLESLSEFWHVSLGQ
jgi:hypothetical protein